jgi:hypothetical protein
MEGTTMTVKSDTPAAPAAQPDLPAQPTWVDRKSGADLVSRLLFPTTPRAIETWPVTWRLLNGKASCETAELLAVAQAKIAAAPLTRTARRQAA